MKFYVRAFIPNPGGPYDPAPIHEFDELEPVGLSEIPQIGDVLISPAGPPEAYRIKDRFLEYGDKYGRCALMVEQVQVEIP